MNIWSFHQFKYTTVHSGNWSSVPVKFTCWNNIFKGLLLLAKLNLSSKTWLVLCSAADLATWFIIKDDSNTDKPKDKHILQWFTNTTQHNSATQWKEDNIAPRTNPPHAFWDNVVFWQTFPMFSQPLVWSILLKKWEWLNPPPLTLLRWSKFPTMIDKI